MMKSKKYIIVVFYCCALLIVGLALASQYQIHRVVGSSMAPAYKSRDLVFSKKNHPIDRYSVISFLDTENDEWLIKRVIGLPGDPIIISGNRMLLNVGSTMDFQLSYSFTLADSMAKEHAGLTQIPEGQYFVLGDHTEVSRDSRLFGFVSEKQIKGTIQKSLKTIKRIGGE